MKYTGVGRGVCVGDGILMSPEEDTIAFFKMQA
jgi:hypothetical protein